MGKVYRFERRARRGPLSLLNLLVLTATSLLLLLFGGIIWVLLWALSP